MPAMKLCLLFVLTLTSLATFKPAVHLEYKVIDLSAVDKNTIQSTLDTFSAGGWQLVQVEHVDQFNTSYSRLYLQRVR
jgi:hypothetical protein